MQHVKIQHILTLLKYLSPSTIFCRAPAVFSILLLLLRDSLNFKIRIQAAAALAVPSTVDGK